MINQEVRHTIEPELADGEELLWADKPVKFLLTPKGVVCFLFLIFFLLFFGWVFFLINELYAWLWFSVCLLYLVYGILEVSFQSYGITDRRIIIINNFIWGDTISLSGEKIWWSERVHLEDDTKNDLGTIYLSSSTPWFNFKLAAPSRVVWFSKFISIRPQIQGLFFIENSKYVESIIPFNTLPWKGKAS